MVAMAPLAIDRPSGPVHVRGRPLGNFTRLAREGSGFAGKMPRIFALFLLAKKENPEHKRSGERRKRW